VEGLCRDQGDHGKHRSTVTIERPEIVGTQLGRRDSSGRGQAAMTSACGPMNRESRMNQGQDKVKITTTTLGLLIVLTNECASKLTYTATFANNLTQSVTWIRLLQLQQSIYIKE